MWCGKAGTAKVGRLGRKKLIMPTGSREGVTEYHSGPPGKFQVLFRWQKTVERGEYGPELLLGFPGEK